MLRFKSLVRLAVFPDADFCVPDCRQIMDGYMTRTEHEIWFVQVAAYGILVESDVDVT